MGTTGMERRAGDRHEGEEPEGAHVESGRHRGVTFDRLISRMGGVIRVACLCIAFAAPLGSASRAEAVAPLAECAPTVTPDELSAGQQAVGYTVRKGTTVESFDVEILGVMQNGIAPGRDLIIVDTSGQLIQDAGGIWFGISGSPIYTLDGKLIGAIAYGFSSTSSIAGVTPADPDMLGVFDEAGSSALHPFSRDTSAPRTVRLNHTVRRRIARRERVRTSSVDDQISQLEVPVTVSGLTAQRRAMLRRAAIKDDAPFFIPQVGSSSASANATPSGTVSPGDSFAAVTSYGDITFAAIGTATYVCDGKALAFGHPFLFNGPTVLGANAANAFGIVQDPVYGPFKLAAVTDPLGVVDRDRLPTIRAQLGEDVPVVPVTQDTTALDTGNVRLGGETEIVQRPNASDEDSLPFIAWIHSLSSIDSVFDQISGGSAHISSTIRGVDTRSGEPWVLSRSNKWISGSDISFDSSFELLTTLSVLQDQKLAPIRFTDIDVDAEVEQTVRKLAISNVLWSKNGVRFRGVRRMRVRPGQTIFARVQLRDSDESRLKSVPMRFHVPRHTRRPNGVITVSGGGSSTEEDPFCFLEGWCASVSAKTFDALLTRLRHQPRNDDLVGRLGVRKTSQRRVVRQPKVVTGHDELLLKPAKPAALPPGTVAR